MSENNITEELQRRITDLERENHVLKNQLEYLELFSENSNTWEAFRDQNGKLFYLSYAFERITGYRRDDFLSGRRDMFSLVHPDDLSSVNLTFQKQIAREKINEFIFRLIDINNDVRDINVCSIPVYSRGDEFIGTHITCIEVTNQKKIEHALLESDTTLKIIMDNANEGIILLDEDGRIIEWNKRIEQVTGLLKGQVADKYIWDIQYRFISEEQKKNLPADFLQQAWQKEVFKLNPDQITRGFGEIISVSGKEEFVEDLVKPVLIAGKKFYCVFQQYITDLKNNEHLLSESEEKFKKIFNLSPVAISLARIRDFIYIDVNQAFSQLTGFSRSELIGHNHLQLGLIKDPSERERILAILNSGNDVAVFPLRIRNKSGVFIDILSSVTQIKIHNEDCILAIHHDVTDLKKYEEKLGNKINELAVANAELEQYAFANQELKQFAYIASHQLQEPIRKVSNYMKIIEEDYSGVLDENAMSYIEIVKDATYRMSILINTLLEFSKLGRDLKLSMVDCNSLMDNVFGDLDYLIKASGASIEIDRLPMINLYETEFRQLMQNLIINAIKFQRKNIKPKIIIRSEKRDRKWEFSIHDNGIGIDMNHYNRIFEIFQRLHFNEEEYEGKGVGLAFCRKIVQLHNGEIWVESTPGQGSVFYFTIPELSVN